MSSDDIPAVAAWAVVSSILSEAIERRITNMDTIENFMLTNMDTAARDLIADVSPNGPGASRGGALRRILVISDGEDSEWGRNPAACVDPVALTQYLIDNKSS
jgi:hypothetical protein